MVTSRRMLGATAVPEGYFVEEEHATNTYSQFQAGFAKEDVRLEEGLPYLEKRGQSTGHPTLPQKSLSPENALFDGVHSGNLGEKKAPVGLLWGGKTLSRWVQEKTNLLSKNQEWREEKAVKGGSNHFFVRARKLEFVGAESLS